MSMTADEMAGAEVSECGVYRYRLWRRWTRSKPLVLWVMLNPSTADAMTDDPTIRRCCAFARRWGYGGIMVVNLFAYRATDPRSMFENDAVWEDRRNMHVLVEAQADRDVDLVVYGWGAAGRGVFGAESLGHMEMLALENASDDRAPHCLGTTKHGHPRHPLYVPKSAELIPWPESTA